MCMYTVKRENLASIKFGENEKNGYELILAKFKFVVVAICTRVWVLRITSCAKFNLAIFSIHQIAKLKPSPNFPAIR